MVNVSVAVSTKVNMQVHQIFNLDCKINTASLVVICMGCSKDIDMQFALIVSRQVVLSTECFIIADYH